MGFYGNITNTARTQFQFDKVYPNRYEMEQKTKTDGIYAGRYILIEYDSDVHLDHMLRVWHGADGWYTQDSSNVNILLKEGNVTVGELVYTASAEVDRNDPRAYKNCVFYKCIGFSDDANKTAKFEEVVDGSSDPNTPAYTVNYNMDTDVFGAGRGYDSTVWQKTYSAEAGEKYVMIAELNTVVPTFAVTPDAPTMNPIVPHFDTQSTDVYYKLHWQAPWGFRVKASEDDFSDEQTDWTTYNYNEGKNTHTKEVVSKNADIYFNEAAFAPYGDEAGVVTKHAGRLNKDGDYLNEIKVAPTGSSDNLYNKHDGTSDTARANDIQEMTIHLPAIGNMMSDAWDIIHGPLRNDDMREYLTDEDGNYLDEDGNKCIESEKDPVRVDSLQGRLNSIAAMGVDEIPVKRDPDGKLVGSKVNGGKTPNQNVDLTGINDDAWIRTEINHDTQIISIHHKFDDNKNGNKILDLRNKSKISGNTKDTSDSINMNDEGDTFTIVTPIVDQMGHTVAKNTQTITLPNNFNVICTDGVSDKTGDIYTQFANDDTLDPNDYYSYVEDISPSYATADNSKDILTINPFNQWIQIKMPEQAEVLGSNDNTIEIAHSIHHINEVNKPQTDLNNPSIDTITIQDLVFDNAGHVTQNQKHTYTLPYSFKTITTNGRSDEVSENATGEPETANVVADTTQDTLAINSGNKWIRIDTDATGDSLTIRHDVHETSDTTSTQTLVSETGVTTFNIPTYTFDKAGHYTSHDTKTITVPFGYGKITGDSGSTAASATYDEVTFASDDWLTATITKDTVTYSHDYPKKVDDTASESNVNGNGDTIVLETLERDDKGHVIKVNENTVTLPFGYKTFTGDSGSTSANNTQDSMSVTGDKWVQTTVSDDKIAFAHIGPVSGTATEVSAETPAFGATFSIDDHYFDDKGHKFTSKSHTVKIPLPSLANGIGNVVTGLSLVPATGALTETKANLGTIQLGTYEAGDSAADLAADITLQQALSRLQNKIANEAANRQTAIEALDVTDTAVAGQYVSAVNEVDGKIQVSRADLPVYATTEQGAKADSALQLNTQITYNDTTNTVEALLNMIIDLQARVTALEEQLNPSEDNTEQSTE